MDTSPKLSRLPAAVFQNAHEIEGIRAGHVLILAADHIYQMDYRPLIREHIENGADATVACIPVPRDEGSSYGIMQIDDDRSVVAVGDGVDVRLDRPGVGVGIAELLAGVHGSPRDRRTAAGPATGP